MVAAYYTRGISHERRSTAIRLMPDELASNFNSLKLNAKSSRRIDAD